ncbi:15154_t:CDS:1, partial [Dentiscutata erythropus]
MEYSNSCRSFLSTGSEKLYDPKSRFLEQSSRILQKIYKIFRQIVLSFFGIGIPIIIGNLFIGRTLV